MKRKLIIISLFTITLVIIKFCVSDYKIDYRVNNYEINAQYKNNRLYFEIKKDKIYNFDIYMKREVKKTMISNIVEIGDETFNCIYPVINNVKTYPLCQMNNEYVDYNLIDSPLLDKYKTKPKEINKPNKDFVYYNNLSKKEYIAIWNYKGYIVMNGDSYQNVEMIKKGRYDNSLGYLIKNTLYMPNYDEEHEFSKLITLNLETLEKGTIELGRKIDYDAYVVGNIKNILYIFDNKHDILYEINLKKQETKIKASNSKGYVKYNGEEFEKCSKSEYKVNKIKYNSTSSLYTYKVDNGIYKTIKDNKKISTKILNKDVHIVSENENILYYTDEDNFYKYTPLKGAELIFYNYEQEFNNENEIFVYTDNKN